VENIILNTAKGMGLLLAPETPIVALYSYLS
jgi:hypothetical protein